MVPRPASSNTLVRLLIALVAAAILVAARPAGAASIVAASCSATNVQAALDRAVTGDAVRIPAGDCTWDTRVMVTSGITLQGAGIGNTIIRDNVSANAVFRWDCEFGAAHRLTGIEFRNGGRRA